MKKILNIYILIAIIFASCDPMEDIYDKVEDEQPLTNVQQLEYTLTDDDYEAMGSSYGNFSNSMPAAENLPAFLAEKYATLDESSSINITYNFYQGSLSYLNTLANSDQYELSSSDYNSFGTEYGEPGYYDNFAWNMPADDYLPDFLLALYPDAEDGQLALITYEYYDNGSSIVSEFYAFDGTAWSASEGGLPEGVVLYSLTADDYDSMGEDSGLPGRYNNFSSSAEPEDYLPTFLEINNPYAQEGDMIAVLYKYYSGSTSTRGKQYTYTNGVWEEYQSTIEKTDQYILTASGWIFDPTVQYEMVAADYQIIVDYVKNSIGEEYLDSYGTAEDYFGASAYYNEFRINEGYYEASEFSSWQEAVSESIQTGLLPSIFPEAVAQVEGVDVFYIVSFEAYAGSMVTHTMTFQCTKSGPNPTFVYVEDSETIK
ncbi:hypothetical protein [Plebeiibacterium sediminum]|uniref:DUF5017 domain-containing protein n=1 Tax=Plebeiibacterium sediminum TaxID=2992112 RepID=A0AAE3M5R3_9BACT|nr:hypothetical protein [Plebeiobacterium sediminum]MCW3787583.1 hypothetical protein [Plebeiobacterium sediminum]